MPDPRGCTEMDGGISALNLALIFGLYVVAYLYAQKCRENDTGAV